MTMNEYQMLAARTINMNLTIKGALHHSLFGLCSEAGELLGIYQKELQGHPVDIEHAKKEASDCLWMIAEWCTVNRIDLDEIATLNIEKLKARYPDGFDSDKSIHRKEGDI